MYRLQAGYDICQSIPEHFINEQSDNSCDATMTPLKIWCCRDRKVDISPMFSDRTKESLQKHFKRHMVRSKKKEIKKKEIGRVTEALMSRYGTLRGRQGGKKGGRDEQV
jgi:hypothetical protein